MTGLIRAAASELAAVRMLRDLISREMLARIVDALDVEDADIRPSLLGSPVVGLAMAAISSPSSPSPPYPRRRRRGDRAQPPALSRRCHCPRPRRAVAGDRPDASLVRSTFGPVSFAYEPGLRVGGLDRPNGGGCVRASAACGARTRFSLQAGVFSRAG
jgi:hypothetical protein